MAVEMEETERRDIFIKIAWEFLGRPYRWGGDDPMAGFDCSGLVVECLKSVGRLPWIGDWTAQGLRARFTDREVPGPCRGCLVFWVNEDGRAVHVEICLNDALAIGASGGGRVTRTGQDAIEQNAYIKVRPIASRGGEKVFLDPFARSV
jgi:cell wall-associated NlpC family hydrolase